MELFRAHHQWAERPDDERFQTLPELVKATHAYADAAAESHDVPWESLTVNAHDDDENLYITGAKSEREALISNWAFGQVASRAGAPPSYLRTLTPELAARNLNYGLGTRDFTDVHDANLLFHRSNGSLVLRAATTEVYERIWNWEVGERLLELADRYDLTPAVPTFQWGSDNAPLSHADPSLYASDHDMFVFLMAREREISTDTEKGLFRAAIFVNSEVGGGSLSAMWFLFRDLCCNHIIWGAQDVNEIRIRHVGQIRDRFNSFEGELKQYLNSSTDDERSMVTATRTLKLGKDKDEVLDFLFGQRKIGMSRKLITAAYEAVVPEEDGDPNTAWGFVQGLTRHSQATPYADERTHLDRLGRKVLQLAF